MAASVAVAGTTLSTSHEKDSSTRRRIAQALRTLGTLPLGETGILAQAWMPVTAEGGATVLQTKGLPYSLIGPGDMLALFRCLSCKYTFTHDLGQQALMGAPGRVFLSGEAETSNQVQSCNSEIYRRVQDATTCRVSSTILIPVFADEERRQAVAVLEVTQFQQAGSPGVQYSTVFDWARKHLQEAGLFTTQQLESRTYEMQSHAFSIKFLSSRGAALGQTFDDARLTAAATAPIAIQSVLPRVPSVTDLAQELSQSQQGASKSQSGGDSSSKDAGEQGTSPRSSKDAPSEADSKDLPGGTRAPPTSWARTGSEQPSGTMPVEAAGRGSLTREDLERTFGLCLKEAAAHLGVCRTTIKRACRRHGIAKWPRRQLLKAARQQQNGSEAMLATTSSASLAQLDGQPQGLRGAPSQQDLLQQRTGSIDAQRDALQAGQPRTSAMGLGSQSYMGAFGAVAQQQMAQTLNPPVPQAPNNGRPTISRPQSPFLGAIRIGSSDLGVAQGGGGDQEAVPMDFTLPATSGAGTAMQPLYGDSSLFQSQGSGDLVNLNEWREDAFLSYGEVPTGESRHGASPELAGVFGNRQPTSEAGAWCVLAGNMRQADGQPASGGQMQVGAQGSVQGGTGAAIKAFPDLPEAWLL